MRVAAIDVFMEHTPMELEPDQEPWRVVTDKVLLQGVSVPAPKGRYDVYVYSRIGPASVT